MLYIGLPRRQSLAQVSLIMDIGKSSRSLSPSLSADMSVALELCMSAAVTGGHRILRLPFCGFLVLGSWLKFIRFHLSTVIP